MSGVTRATADSGGRLGSAPGAEAPGEGLPDGLRAVAVAVFGAAVYLNALRNGFAIDDVPIVRDNAAIHRLATLPRLLVGGYWPDSGEMYRPLTLISFALDWSVSGGHPAYLHAVNILLHGAVCALIYLLLVRLRAPRLPALLGAAVFAVHPVHVEAVANLVGRAELLSTGFVLLGCLAFLDTRRHGAIRALLVAGCYAAGLAAKETAVTLPGLVLLLSLIGTSSPEPLRARLLGLFRRDRLVYAASAATLAIYLAVRLAVLGREKGVGTATLLHEMGPLERLATAVRLWPEYARLMLWPNELSMDWGPPLVDLATWRDGMVAAGLLLGLLALWAALRTRHRTPWVWVALGWFAIAALPVSQIPFAIGVLLAERLLYLPSVGLAFGVVALFELAAAAPLRRPQRTALAVMLVGLIALGAARTWSRTPTWRSTETAVATLLREHPASYRSRWQAAELLRSAGRFDAAAEQYAHAVRLTRGGYYNLAIEYVDFLLLLGRAEEAEPVARAAVAQHPEIARGYHALAASLIDQERYAEARQVIEEGKERARFGPGTATRFAHRIALVFDGLGMHDAALREAERAISPDNSARQLAEWLHLARLRLAMGDSTGAKQALDRVRTAEEQPAALSGYEPLLSDLASAPLRSWRWVID